MVSRELFLAKADQDVALARTQISDLVTQYAQHMDQIRDSSTDEIDVLCALMEHLAHGQVDGRFDRVHVLATVLAVAVKMLHEQGT